MWDLSGPGLEPVSRALAGGFLTTAPPGKSENELLNFLRGEFFSGGAGKEGLFSLQPHFLLGIIKTNSKPGVSVK